MKLLFRLSLEAMLLGGLLVLSVSTAKAENQTLRHADPVWHGNSLAHLSKYIGTDNNQAVLDDPEVAAAMKQQLRENYEAARERLLSRPGIIDFYLFFIVLEGSLDARDNHIEAAILVLDLTNGLTYTGPETGGTTIVYGNHGPDIRSPDYGELPWPLLVWVKQTELQHIAWEPPTKNFEWKFKAPPSEPK